MTRIDIVVPIRNEAANIPHLVQRIEALNLPPDVRCACLFVEDGSSDESVDVLRNLSREKSNVDYYSMANGFGEGPAMVFGISRSEADGIITMDADGSCPVDAIPEMIHLFCEGAEVVQCRRKSLTGRAWYRDASAAAFGLVVRGLTGNRLEDQNTYYRLISHRFAREILEMPRLWRFVRFPLPSRDSGALKTIDVEMTERTTGKSTYSMPRLLALACDGLLAYLSWRRLAGVLAVFLLGALALGFAGYPGFAGVVALPAAAMLYRFLYLGRTDYLSRLVVVESSRPS